jgi:ligand-binding SRPBCC domain-containing protein
MAGMETIRLGTWINAPVERCFLLSLSVDLHVAAARSTRDTANAAATEGMIGEGETLTFKGRHFGVRWRHTSLIEKLRPHSYYRDVMIAGPFQHFEHDHHFAAMDDGTRMRDDIRFSARGGLMGRLATRIYLRKRLKAYLIERNAMIKQLAESEDWQKYLETGVEGPAAASVKGEAPERWNGKTLLRGSQQIVATRPPTG